MGDSNEFSQCKFCNRWMREKDHKHHFNKMHDLGDRETRGHEEIFERDGEEYELFILDDMDLPIYCCKWCSIGNYDINGIINHTLLHHKLSIYEAKTIKTYGPTCQICWIQFDNQEQLDNHFTSKIHKKKDSYVDGSGCDICRVTLFGKLTHEETRRHQLALNYVKGSGCHECYVSFETMKEYFTVKCPNTEPTPERLMAFHKSYPYYFWISCPGIVRTENLNNGGCEICNFEGIDEHYKSGKHKGMVTRMTKFRKSRQKSARSVK